MLAEGIAVNILLLKPLWEKTIAETLQEASIAYPLNKEGAWFHKGGKDGIHTEHLGFLLAEMQYLQRSYPGASW